MTTFQADHKGKDGEAVDESRISVSAVSESKQSCKTRNTIIETLADYAKRLSDLYDAWLAAIS